MLLCKIVNTVIFYKYKNNLEYFKNIILIADDSKIGYLYKILDENRHRVSFYNHEIFPPDIESYELFINYISAHLKKRNIYLLDEVKSNLI